MDSNTLAMAAALALLVRIGHTLHTLGCVRARNVAAVAARAALTTACIVLAVYLLGRGLSWLDGGASDVNQRRTMIGEDIPAGPRRIEGLGVFFASPTSFLSILALSLLPASLVEAATAERARVRGVILASLSLTLFVLPVLISAGWAATSSFDRPRGEGSYAASLSGVGRIWPVVAAHLVAGAGAIAIAKTIGGRSGKYNRDGSANLIPAHALPLIVGGDLLLLLGLPMMAAALAGDLAARVVNTLLAASAAALVAALMTRLRERRIDVQAAWQGVVGGAVAGSVSGAAYPTLAVSIGVFVGVLLPAVSRKLDLRWRVDEPTGLAAPHLLGALLGAVGAGIESALESGASTGSGMILGSIVACGCILAALLVAALAFVPALVLKQIGWLRVDEIAESEGLDLAQHDVNAYPDFQQTLIKSYHLRQ